MVQARGLAVAVTQNDVVVKIAVQAEGAESELKKLRVETEKTSASFNQLQNETKQLSTQSAFNFQSLATAAAAATAAYYTIIAPLKQAVTAYSEAEAGSIKLRNILALVGEDVQKTAADFESFAEVMQRQTAIDDDVVVGLLAQAKAIGLTNEQAKEAVTAASNLASVYGENVTQSFDRVLASYRGNERALGPLARLMGDLTDEQIRQGAHVKRLNEYLKDLASQGLESTQGQQKRLVNQLGQLSEAIGGIIIKSIDYKQNVKGATSSLEEFTIWVTRNTDAIIKWIRYLGTGIDMIFEFASAIALLAGSGIGKVIDSVFGTKLSDSGKAGIFAINQGMQSFQEFVDKAAFKDLEDSVQSLDRTMQKAGATSNKFAIENREKHLLEKKSMEELAKKYDDLVQERNKLGKSDMELAELRLMTDKREIDVLAKRLEGNKKQQRFAGAASKVAEEIKTKTQQLIIEQTLNDILWKNQDITNDTELVGKDGLARLEKEAEIRALAVEKLRERYKLEKKNTWEIEEGLNAQLNLLEKLHNREVEAEKAKQAEKEKEKAKSEFKVFEQPTEAINTMPFMQIADSLSGYISALQKIVDFIPSIINQISKLIDSITNFAKTLYDSVKGLSASIINYIKNFTTNLFIYTEKIIEVIVTTTERIPDAFAEMLSRLPDVMLRFIDRVPDLVKRFSSALVVLVPKIAIAFAVAIGKQGPHIAKNLSWALAVELPKAIILGILDGFRQEWDIITGQFDKIDILNPENVTALTDKLTGDISQIFRVSDLVDSEGMAGPYERLKGIGSDIEDVFVKGMRWLIDAWHNIWSWISDRWLEMLQGLRDIGGKISELWKGVFVFGENAMRTLLDGLDLIANVFLTLKDGLYTNVVQPLQKVIAELFGGIPDMFSKLDGIGANVAAGISSSMNDVLKQLFDGFYNIGRNLKNGIADALNSIAGPLGELIGKISKISIEVPTIKIPGKAYGGIIGGTSSVAGDSFLNDKVLALLSPGEAVIPRSKMADPGIADTVKSILSGNSGRPSGGMMPIISSGGNTQNISLGGLTINTTQTIDADFVRGKLMPTIQKELRRASLDGQTVIYKAGIR
jgi:hypothetical protein